MPGPERHRAVKRQLQSSQVQSVNMAVSVFCRVHPDLHYLITIASHIPADLLECLDAYESNNRCLWEELAEVKATVQASEQRLSTMGLFFTDRLLWIWEHVSSQQETVSRGMQGIWTVLEEDADRRARLEVIAEELKLFLGAPHPVPDPALHINDFAPPPNWVLPEFEQHDAEAPIQEVAPPLPSIVEQPLAIEATSTQPWDELPAEPPVPVIQMTLALSASSPLAASIPGSPIDAGCLSPLPPILRCSSSTPRKRTASPAVEDAEAGAKRQRLD